MHLPLFIAKRYLFAKKSHNVINIISLISSIGIGIGSMALIIILSVYNGFDTLVRSFYQEYQPTFIITPQEGKSFTADSSIIKGIEQLGDKAATVFPIIEETVFIEYNSRQSIANIKGVDTVYGVASGVVQSIKEGGFKLYEGEIPHAVIGAQLAAELRLRVRFIEPVEIYFPDREANISILNPMASLNNETVYAGGIISLNNEFDAKSMFIPLATARELLGYAPDEVTSLEIYIANGLSGGTEEQSNQKEPDTKEFEKELEQLLNGNDNAGKPKYIIKDKYKQNETLYKMMRAEKFAVYLILFFVILIVSVNIFGSLSMLIIDKQHDMETYKSMGASEKLIKRIFVLQGWLISLIGAAVGIAIGLILCFIQQQFGLISMPGNYIISAYPVNIHFTDVLITFFGVALIGYLIALLPSRVKLF